MARVTARVALPEVQYKDPTHPLQAFHALGVSPGDVVRLLALQETRPILLGIGVGTALAFVAMRLLRTAVYGVSLSDPMSLAGAAAILFLAGLTAALVPARRATRIDPAHTIMRG